MSTRRPLLAVLVALSCCAATPGCKSDSSPTKPGPEEEARGSIVLLRNDSYYSANVAAGFDCSDDVKIEMAVDDFSPVYFDFDLSCSAEAQGEGHSGNIELRGSQTYEYEGPADGLSAIRVSATAVANRSATGLASAGGLVRVRLRFEVVGDPVPFRASGAHVCTDNFPDWFRLRDAAAPLGTEIFYLACGNQTGELDLDTAGMLPPGVYDLWVQMQTLDWFTEEMNFALLFTE